MDAPFEFYPVFQSGKQMVVTFTDQVLVKALEIALTRMKAGDTALVYSMPKYALGEAQARTYNTVVVPPNSSVIYKVTLLQIIMDTGRINPYLPIQKAITQKTIANDLYQCEWPEQCDRALTLYGKAARVMETLLHGIYLNNVEADHPQRKQVKELMLDSLNNIVAVHMRNKQYDQAYEAARQVLRRDPRNVKALFRAAKSRMMNRKCSLSEQDEALCAAENVIIYKDKEEVELKKLRAQWKKRKQITQDARPTE
jgi:tetratricopeptide (TPR) repeat protein